LQISSQKTGVRTTNEAGRDNSDLVEWMRHPPPEDASTGKQGKGDEHDEAPAIEEEFCHSGMILRAGYGGKYNLQGLLISTSSSADNTPRPAVVILPDAVANGW